uniref:Zinc finger protein 706 n=1 Tax=Anas platyrhynchos TaxID=8839 RepID=A0A8B9R2E6_ANAPL
MPQPAAAISPAAPPRYVTAVAPPFAGGAGRSRACAVLGLLLLLPPPSSSSSFLLLLLLLAGRRRRLQRGRAEPSPAARRGRPEAAAPRPDMARGQQKIQSQQKNAKKQAEQKKKQGHDQKAAAKAALIYTCTVCRTQMPDPKTFKQHFESKHPKTPLPPELADVQA